MMVSTWSSDEVDQTHILETLGESHPGPLESANVCVAIVAVGSHAIHVGVLQPMRGERLHVSGVQKREANARVTNL
jgi:hypothetical protein